ncbi:DEAD/DEAH box helicase family protein [Cyanobium sp. WKJ7-Wakatipu]|uniref:DEAD/DEAH box helicase n=1 Tax=Cyanobium sp. WKJ7-Wakatipu TaxID=2823726 RepID=UPI0020CD503C|nr:DEAD/DEAH box helicase [Cyanobium sp. WKJ7-Wakatipu]MCP9784048.1 DEAD/DEAH box helicase family protein [Cyanobium sp. WKJ7-Wakatipu]
MELRPYQETCVEQVLDRFEAGHKSVLLIAGTGSGKTAVATRLVKDFWEAGLPVMFQITLDTLAEQTLSAFTRMGIPEDEIGIIRGGTPEHRDRPVQIASQQTLIRRDWWQRRHWGLCVLDEAHISDFSNCARKTREVLPKARYLGLTASPWRMSKKQGFDQYTAQVNAPAPAALQEMGFLSPMRYFVLPEASVDLKKVRTLAGDFATDDLVNACNRPEVVEASIREWQRRTPGRRTLAFTISVEHAEAVAATFNAAGIPAATVTGETPRARRAELYQQLHDRELMVLSSCMALATGFDLPSAEVGLLMRPTKSQALHIQQIGRIARPWDEKDCGWILDQAGNCLRFPYPRLEDIPADLRRQMPQESMGPGGEGNPVKVCPDCAAVLPNFTQLCPHCEHDFRKAVLAHTGPLVELISQADALATEPPESRLRAQFHKLRKTAFQRGLMPGWAWHRFKEAAGREPLAAWFVGSTFRNPTPAAMNSYATYLALMADRRGIDGRSTFIATEMNREFGPNLQWQRVVDINEL